MRALRIVLCVVAAASLVAACTTLGPMPAMSGATPIPPPRTGVELQLGVVPGYFLSSSVQQEIDGASINQLAALVDVGGLLSLPGLTVGGRYVGEGDQGGYPEPTLGYRWYLGPSRRLAAGIFGYGAHGSGAERGASYSATRGGLDGSIDIRLTPEYRWLELHLVATASFVALSAKGTYCTDDAQRFAVECPEDGDGPGNMTTAEARGLYPAGSAGIAVDSGRHLAGYFHGVRFLLDIAGGSMPRVEMGEQQTAALWAAFGLSLTIGVGSTN